jgi:predicted nucleotidyltransferase
MITELESKIPEIQAICARYPVATLSAFGSAVTGGFEQNRSDIDLLVKMADVPTLEYGRAYFSLLREFEDLFDRPIDLVTEPSLTNPYIKQSVDATKVLIYEHG